MAFSSATIGAGGSRSGNRRAQHGLEGSARPCTPSAGPQASRSGRPWGKPDIADRYIANEVSRPIINE